MGCGRKETVVQGNREVAGGEVEAARGRNSVWRAAHRLQLQLQL